MRNDTHEQCHKKPARTTPKKVFVRFHFTGNCNKFLGLQFEGERRGDQLEKCCKLKNFKIRTKNDNFRLKITSLDNFEVKITTLNLK
jgi:hypothetical protein